MPLRLRAVCEGGNRPGREEAPAPGAGWGCVGTSRWNRGSCGVWARDEVCPGWAALKATQLTPTLSLSGPRAPHSAAPGREPE